MIRVDVFPEGLLVVETDVGDSKWPVCIELKNEHGYTKATVFLSESQADSLFGQLGNAARKIEAASRKE